MAAPTAGAPSLAGVALHPPFAFLRNYILRGGFRDGSAGLLVSMLNSYYVFLKLAKLWELQQPQRRDRTPSATRSPIRRDPRIAACDRRSRSR